MLAHVFSCTVVGLNGVIVDIEVDYGAGLPHMAIVGLPDEAVKESRERVYSAIKNANLVYPNHALTVNLAPASVRKEGPSFDLPIAVGVLICSEQIAPDSIADSLIIGELSLDGSVRHVRGILSVVAKAREEGYKQVFVPAEDAQEAALIPDIKVFPVTHLNTLVQHLMGEDLIAEAQGMDMDTQALPGFASTDFSEIKGQEQVKRAMEVAAAGGHNLIMSGPPGSGKTLLARAMPSILPAMTLVESLEVTRIYSICNLLPAGTPLVQTRPFRSPHHTVSHAGLVGGGTIPRPGEISLAHRGVLFLDELPEFGQRMLEVLRQPLEDKAVTISRANGSLTFPANFMLVGAMNPCPCGYYGDNLRACTCASAAISAYQKRISGPLLDRMDISLHVPRVDYLKLSSQRQGESSATVQARVEEARKRQLGRFVGSRLVCNAEMGPKELRAFCTLTEAGDALMKSAMRQMKLSARGYHRVLKLARTIADLSGVEAILPEHLAEALQYRVSGDTV